MCLLAIGSARAAFEVTLSDSRGATASHTIIDGNLGSGDTDGLANNSITVSGLTVGGYQFNGVLSTTNSPGVSGVAQDTANFTVVDQSTAGFTGAGTAGLYASASGFNDPTGASIFAVTTSTFLQNGGGSGTGNVQSRFDSANVLSTTPTGTVIGSAGPVVTTLATPQTGTATTFPFTLPSAYALNLLLSIAMPSGGDFSNTSQVTLFGIGRGPNPTPEPATMAIWGLGALGFAAVRFRRRKA